MKILLIKNQPLMYHYNANSVHEENGLMKKLQQLIDNYLIVSSQQQFQKKIKLKKLSLQNQP